MTAVLHLDDLRVPVETGGTSRRARLTIEADGSLRLRAINHYRLDGVDTSIVATGHTVFDAGLAKTGEAAEAAHETRPFRHSLEGVHDRAVHEAEIAAVARTHCGTNKAASHFSHE